MKLVIMIPCLNEETTLPLVLTTIPKQIPGIDDIDVLVIDDGSTDKTAAVARRLGVRHFIHHSGNRGLALSLRDGIRGALELQADILVLTDGDNQYPQERIPDLIRPILDGAADTVIADRQVRTIEHFSPMKKFLQKLGTGVLNRAAGTGIPDGTSGFRAYSREAAMKLNLIGRFNFAMETALQAAHKRLNIVSIPIETNPKTRESRLFKSSWEHVRKSALALMNAYIMYKPLAIFLALGLILLVAGLAPLIYFFTVAGEPAFDAHRFQFLLVGSVLITGSFVSLALGVVANLVRINRVLLEDVLEELRRQRHGSLVEEIDGD